MKKKILIKASGITAPSWRGYNAGVGRSTLMLLKSLAKISNLPFDIEIYASGLSSVGFDFHNLPFKHFSFPIPEKIGCELTRIEPFIRSKFVNYDLLHIPHNLDEVHSKESYIVTLHDVIAYDRAIANNDIKTAKKWQKMASRAKAIMTCSQYSKSEIVSKLNICPEVVSVVYWGASTDKFYIEDKNITKRNLHLLGIDGPYFVSISCAHPRKNIRILLKAFQLFLQTNPKHKLVLVWSNPPQDILQTYAKEISDLKIVFLKYVSDEYLRSLYNGATLTMYPSRSEGFGFTILESFGCGSRVMTCLNSCLQEICRDFALYVGEDNVDEMVDVMKYFEKNLFNMELFKKMSNNLLPSFSWDETASKYVDFYTKSLLL